MVKALAIPFFQAQPKLDPSGPRQLTLREALALDWALSKEGQYARQFMKWNQTLLGGKDRRVCSSEVSRLGVTLTLEGREAVNGFCTLWVALFCHSCGTIVESKRSNQGVVYGCAQKS